MPHITPYDDAYKTLLHYCPRLIWPILNELFGECYTGEEKVVFFSDEHMENDPYHKQSKA